MPNPFPLWYFLRVYLLRIASIWSILSCVDVMTQIAAHFHLNAPPFFRDSFVPKKPPQETTFVFGNASRAPHEIKIEVMIIVVFVCDYIWHS